jgi:PH domain
MRNNGKWEQNQELRSIDCTVQMFCRPRSGRARSGRSRSELPASPMDPHNSNGSNSNSYSSDGNLDYSNVTSEMITQQLPVDGILWKRRDLFTAQWRPRWFRVQEDTGLLTYYLLRNQDVSITVGPNCPLEIFDNVDYETVPRGSIHLPGCLIESQQALTRPDEKLFVLRIIPLDNKKSAPCYLAAMTEQDRDKWVETLSRACSPDEGGMDSVRRKLQFSESSTDSNILEEDLPDPFSSIEQYEANNETSSALLAVILFTPLMLWKYTATLPNQGVIFLIAMVIAIRIVMRLLLGNPFQAQTVTGVVTCQCMLPLRGALRLIAKRKHDERMTQDISLRHIVVKAVSQALSEFDAMNCRRVIIPLLGIDDSFSREHVNVSILQQGQLLTLQNVQSKSINDIFEIMSEQQRHLPIERNTTIAMRLGTLLPSLFPWNERIDAGSCLIIHNSLDDEGNRIDMAVSPINGFNATVSVGSICLVKSPRRRSQTTPRAQPTPKFSMTITMNCSVCDALTCRRFAQRIQQLVELPMDG